MARIERIGGVEPFDAEGCIVNPARLDRIAAPWHAAVEDVVERCRAAFGGDLHSVYVRGSVPRGLAIEGFSDLDMVVALRDFAPLPIESEVAAMESAVQAKFPFVRGVEMAVVSRGVARAPLGCRAAIVLKAQAVCVFGRDLMPEIPPFRFGPGAMLELPRAASSIGHVVGKLRGRASEDETRAYCAWLMKILVRAAFESIADRETGYTRDLYFCAEAVVGRRPERAEEVWHAVEWAIEPPREKVRVLRGLAMLRNVIPPICARRA
jgi:uncharacterized protein